MDLVETYFKPEYEEYHRNLSDATVLEATVRDAKDTVETVSTQFQSTTLLLQEFQGDFVEELDESIVLLIEELKMSNSLINDSLEPTIEAMKTLGSKLGDLKTNDGLYKEQKTKYQQLSNSDNRLIEDHESEEYKDWLSERNNAETTLKGYIDVCKGLQEECDSYIKTIEDFNNSVVDLRLKLTYFAISQCGIEGVEGMSLEDILSLSMEEKQKYLQELLDKLKEEYEEAKKAYQDAINSLTGEEWECFMMFSGFLLQLLPDDEVGFGYEMVAMLRGEPGFDIDGFDGSGSDMSFIAYGQYLPKFIEWYNTQTYTIDGEERSLKDMMGAYMNGSSLADSGLLAVYKANKDSEYYYYGDSESDSFYREKFLEQYHIYFDDYDNYDDYEEAIRGQLRAGLDVVQRTSDVFEEQYSKQLAKGLMYKSILSLKQDLPFNEIRMNDPEYKAFGEFDTSTFDQDWFNDPTRNPSAFEYYFRNSDGDMEHVSFDTVYDPSQTYYLDDFQAKDGASKVFAYLYGDHAMTGNERKMLGYLCSQGRYEEASNYVDIIERSVNKRTGEMEAESIYYSWLRGTNKGADLAWDNLCSFVDGIGEGTYDYFSSFNNLFDPDVVPTSTDYKIMRMKKLISQPVYCVEGNYYGEEQINDVMAANGYYPCGASPKDGYSHFDGKTFSENPEIIPENTLWDETVRTTHGAGYGLVETGMTTLTKAIHPAFAAVVDTVHDLGADRKKAEQTASAERANITSGFLNDGVDYDKFWSDHSASSFESALNIVSKMPGEVGECAKLIKNTYDVAKAYKAMPDICDDMYNAAVEGDWGTFITKFDKLAGKVGTVSGGEFDVSSSHWKKIAKDKGKDAWNTLVAEYNAG